MGHVFVSYSRRDKELVDLIIDSLKGSGMNVWIDREAIKAGKTWRVQIVQAIDTCDAFILMLSPNSIMSDNVRREIDLAQDAACTMFPVMLEPVKLPPEIRYQLTGLQFIDVQMLGFDESVKQLISTVNEQLAKVEPQPTSTRQTELVIQGIDLASFGDEKKQQLLGFLANLCNTDQSNLMIAGMTAGSVHVFVDMPADSAFALKTMALNREKRLKKFGITALRITGDSKFVNIALGVLTATATIGIIQLLWLSIPPLLPSLFGVAAGKVIVVASAVALTTAVGVEVANSDINLPLLNPIETLTSTVTATRLPTNTLEPTSIPAKTPKPTLESSQTPSKTTTPTSTITSSPTFTPSKTNTPTYTATRTPTITSSPTFTPTPTPTKTATNVPPAVGQAGFSISNVQLNSSGSSVMVAPGSSVSITLNYQVWSQTACPYCIDQIVIGLNATALYCAYHGIPGTAPGVNGSNANSFTAPGASGTYTLYASFQQQYTCGNALSLYSPGTPIGTISVAAPLISFTRGIGDYSCPAGYTLATYAEATDYADSICSVLDTWDIARLEGGGSFDGPGYGCGFRSLDDQSLGHSVCKKIP